MQKNNVILASFIVLLIFGVLQTNYLTHNFCTVASSCSSVFKFYKFATLLSVAVFPISLLMVFLKSEINTAWQKFTLFSIGIYIFTIIISPNSGADFLKIEKGTVAIGLTALYFLISLILIAFKSYKLRGK